MTSLQEMVSASGLSGEQTARVLRVLEGYLAELEGGAPPQRDELLARHPDLADLLAEYLDKLDQLHQAAAGLRAAPPAEGVPAAPLGERGRLGDFDILREVGRGGMGIVYEAEQVSLGRRVALKVLPFAATLDPRQLQRFHNEARAAASLHHEHIVPVFAVGCERAVHFYAMQFIEGKSLAELIAAQDSASRGRQPAGAGAEPDTRAVTAASTEAAPRDAAYFRRVAEWGIQAAEALEHAHALGIVHRDVKPANLIVDGQGKLWVTDFGLARTVTDAGLTVSGDLLGTLRYMSPEQALARHGLVDHRTDVYSLGATLYELLTGRPAVEGQDRQEIVKRIADEEPPPPRALDGRVPADLETIVLKMLAKEPGERYATARELADDLGRFLEDRPIQARRAGLMRRGARWVRRRKSMVAAAVGTALVALVVFITGLLWHNGQLRDAAERERAQAEQARRERDRAEEERRWARQAVEDMYTQVAEKWLKRQPRLEPVQQEFLEKALRYYAHEAEQQGDDPEVRPQVALAQYRLGAIYYRLGRHAEAREAFARAIPLFERLAAEFSGEAEYEVKQAHCHFGLGNVAQALGRHEEAAGAYRDAIEAVKKKAGDAVPSSPDALGLLVKAQDALAMILAETGKVPEAERTYRDAIDLGGQLVKKSPGTAEFRSLLANTHNNLGNMLYTTGRLPEAEPEYREAVRLFEQLAEEVPTEPGYRDHWAFNLSNLASLLRATGRARDAKPLLLQARSVLQRRADDFPAVPDYQWELSACHNNLGITLKNLGEYAEAEQSYRQAIATDRKLVAGFPAVLAYRSELARHEMNLGNFLGITLGRPVQAEEAYRRAADIQQKLAAEFPGVPAYRADLADTSHVLGQLLSHLGRAAEAAEPLGQAVKLLEELAAAIPGDISYRSRLARSCNRLALVFVWHQGPPCPEASRAVALTKRAVELEPKAAHYWITGGVAHYRAGNWKESSTALERARELGAVEDFLGLFAAMAYWRMGNEEEARRHYGEAAGRMDRKNEQDEQLLRFRAEAAALLGIQKQAPKDKEDSSPKK